ncbi:MAG: methionine--tRNA ligase [Acidobacteriota bacterium]|nr:methionine--tRNA ligase [Blastocatellia bacterium]MDW8412027.1 methionine--tRNA ligase [Acidobacteriota bacterium]
MGKFYVTTPIYYVNSRPHLGHAYTTMVADLVARYRRQRGDEVFFLTGTDEHGQNIERAASASSLPVREHVDRIVAEYKQTFSQLGFTYDYWIRTTDDYHKQGVQQLFRKVKENGYVYLGHYEGWYCVGCAEFKEETVDGSAPYCELHDRLAERLSEESYFFRLSEFQEKLLDYYERNPKFIRPEARRNEVIAFVKAGLKDLSISRVSVKWGIPVPDDPKHTLYVWFDALSNYITALGYGNYLENRFDKFWPADLHLVGKDILRFHAVYWPAFLMAAGIEPPRTVFAHGMWLSGGRKMSKTVGNVIDLNTLMRHFSNDQVRYFCYREMSFGQDGDFTYEALIDRVNADLAKGLGNLYSRTMKMIEKYCDGKLPSIDASKTALGDVILAAKERFEREMQDYNFSRALEVVWEAISAVDKYISDSAPWKLAKDPAAQSELQTVLYSSAEAIRHLTLLLAPILPTSAETMWKGMGLEGTPLNIVPATVPWASLPQTIISPPVQLFPTIDKEKLMAEIAKSSDIQTEQKTPTVTIEDFAKIDLRVALVLEAERVPKADKLLRLIVDLGEDKPRQIVAGIAQYYAPEQLIGRKIIVVANLEPRKLRGLESQGMLLAAQHSKEGRPILAGFLEDVPVGAKLK